MNKLVPSLHIFHGLFNANHQWHEIIAECIDNAFDRSAGNANNVIVRLEKNKLHIEDDGQGVKNVNALLKLGASESFYHDNNLGQYGYGAKAFASQANALTVQTTHNHEYHDHTFDLSQIYNKIKNKEQLGDFDGRSNLDGLEEYGGIGSPCIHNNGTCITIHKIRRTAKTIRLPTIITKLERLYWPALMNGKQIIFVDNRKKEATKVSLQALSPPNWTDLVEFESEVNGKRYKAKLGILTDNIGVYHGLFVGYLFRTICIEKKLINRTLPARIHGQIELSEDWRHSLSHYKNDIIDDKKDLLIDLEKNAKKLFDLADEYVEDLYLDKVASSINASLNSCLRAKVGGSETGGHRKRKSGKKSATPKTKKRQPRKPTEKRAAEKQKGHNRVNGVRFGFAKLGFDVLGHVSMTDKVIDVRLNRDCPKIHQLSKQDKYPGLYLAIGEEIAMYALKNMRVTEIEDRFGGMISAEGEEDKINLINSIRLWFGFEAAEDNTVIQNNTQTP